jgi:hypothetical protein
MVHAIPVESIGAQQPAINRQHYVCDACEVTFHDLLQAPPDDLEKELAHYAHRSGSLGSGSAVTPQPASDFEQVI